MFLGLTEYGDEGKSFEPTMRERMAEEHWAIVNRYVGDLVDILSKDAADGSEVTKVTCGIFFLFRFSDKYFYLDRRYVLLGHIIGTRRRARRGRKKSVFESRICKRHSISASVSKVDHDAYFLIFLLEFFKPVDEAI